MCGCLLRSPYWGPCPVTQACALTGNRTGHPLVHRPALNPLNHTSQGPFTLIFNLYHVDLMLALPILKNILFIFRERGREEEREGEKHRCVRETSVWEICPQSWTQLATQACTLTGIWIGDLLIRRSVLRPLSHPSQGGNFILNRTRNVSGVSSRTFMLTEMFYIWMAHDGSHESRVAIEHLKYN